MDKKIISTVQFEVIRSEEGQKDPNDRTFRCICASEQPVLRWFDGEIVDEVIPIDSWKVTKESKVPLLDTHNRYDLSSIKGSAYDFEKTGDKMSCTIEFSKAAEEEFIKTKEGHLNSVSVGGGYSKAILLDKEQETELFGKTYKAGKVRKMLISKETFLGELSLVPLPADKNAKIETNKMDYDIEQINKLSKGEVKMEKETEVKIEKTETTEVEVDKKEEEVVEVAVEKQIDPVEIVKIERARIAEIESACTELNLPVEFKKNLIENGTSVEDASKLILAEVKKMRKDFNVSIAKDSSENIREALSIVTKRSLGVQLTEKEVENVSKSVYNSYATPCTVARACLENAGVRTNFMSNADIYDNLTRSQQGVADFTYITANAGNTQMEKIFQEIEMTSARWTGEMDVSNFNVVNMFDVMPIGEIPVIADKGPVTDVGFAEYAESVQLVTRGAKSNLSRQAIINDDFGAFALANRNLAEAYIYTIEKATYDKLIANPTMKDSKALFHDDHHNLGTSALSSTSLSAAKTALMRMVDANGRKIGRPGSFLIVPSELEDTAKKLIYSSVDLDNTQVINPHKGLELVASQFLSDVDDWYLAGLRGNHIVRVYLNGQRTPELQLDAARGAEALGFTYRVVFDVAIGARSPFYIYKSAYSAQE